MNQGVNSQTMDNVDSNPLERCYNINANQGQTTSYFSSTNGPEAVTWPIHRVEDHSAENGSLSNSRHEHGRRAVLQPSNVQDGVTAMTIASSSAFGAIYASQDFSGYTSHSNAADPYGYGSTVYTTCYGGYQQQPNYSNSQQQPANSYSLQQACHSYPQQQADHSYSQPVGACQNTGAPYQPLSSFQNTGSYAGSASYSTTYQNPGDYQTAGGYASSGYAAASVDCQQQYNPWADYYSQTEVICPPGTEHLSVTSTSNQGSAVPGVTSAHSTPNGQPPQSHTSSWKPEPSSTELSSLQHGAATSGAQECYWKQKASSFQHHHASPMQSHFQKSLDLKNSYDNFQEQQKTAPQGPNIQYAAAQQVLQSYQLPLQTVPSLDTRRVGKLQIPTNPRIASNLPLGISKSDKEGSTTSATAKAVYISVSVPQPNEKVLSNDVDDPIFKPGMFPNSLQGYCERAFARCKDNTQMLAVSQGLMKEIITKAKADGTLYTRDWDIEPLFPIPNADVVNKENSQSSTPLSSLPKCKKSPRRRPKSRWEPLPEEKPVNKLASVGINAAKYGIWDKKPLSGNSESKDDSLNNVKFSISDQRIPRKGAQKPLKRQRLADDFNATDHGDASSDSDNKQALTSYYSGAIALANAPEEKKRREKWSRRFQRGQGQWPEINYFKPKNFGAGNSYHRWASALTLSKNFDDGGSRAVEDIDWDSLTVKGTCQEIEKCYLRLTSAPDPATVRPENVLEKALLMVLNSQKTYLYKCDQLKAIRQDLTVQRIRNQLTVKVYETHARLALEAGDLPEYNQCQSQLKTLYAEGIEGCHLEFAAYNLLCVILHSNNKRDFLSSMSRLTKEAKKDQAIKHALAVRAAVASGNYVTFFRLYKMAPNLNTCLMDLCVEKIRYKAVSCMSRSYRPTLPVAYIAEVLGFSGSGEGNDEKDSDGLEECVDWLKAHGACLTADSSGEMQLDTKASSSSLYVPEPEDAVSHGDTSLAVNDFLTRASLQPS